MLSVSGRARGVVRGWGAGGRRLFGTLPAVALLAATGCAAGKLTWFDKGQAAISRGLADVVDAADGAFGEPRVVDRERVAVAKIGAAVTVRENEDTT